MATKASVPADIAGISAGQRDPHSPGRRHDGTCGTACQGRLPVAIDERDNECMPHASTCRGLRGWAEAELGGHQPRISRGSRLTRATCSDGQRIPIVQSTIRIGARTQAGNSLIATSDERRREAPRRDPVRGWRDGATPESRTVRGTQEVRSHDWHQRCIMSMLS